LGLGPSEGLERDIAEFPRELSVSFRDLVNPLPWKAGKRCLVRNRLDGCLALTIGDEEKIPRQHQIEDLPPSVRADSASPNGADNNVVPVTCRPRIIGDLLAAIAKHNLRKCIETFQRMGLH